jgi:hypothetical protein
MATQTATNLIKHLTSMYPQHFVSWLLPDAQFKESKSTKLPDTSVETDALIGIIYQGQETLLQIRGLVYDEPDIEQQLLEYSACVKMRYRISPLTYVLCLREGKSVAAAALAQKYLEGERSALLDCCYVRKLWELPTDELLQLNMAGLFPLLPLTKQGGSRENVDRMIEAMILARQFDLIPLGEVATGLVVRNETERIWLKRRFAMYRTH